MIELNDLANGTKNNSNLSMKQETIIAKSTGVVREVVLSKGELAYSPIKIDTLEISFNDGTGKQMSIDIALQIFPAKTGENVIPWFVQGVYQEKFDKALERQTLGLGELGELFNEGSTLAFVPLLKSNFSEGIKTQDIYTTYLYLYYNEEEWSYLEEAYKNKFNPE